MLYPAIVVFEVFYILLNPLNVLMNIILPGLGWVDEVVLWVLLLIGAIVATVLLVKRIINRKKGKM